MQRIIKPLASEAETGSMRLPVPITVAGPCPGNFVEHLQRDLHIVLLISAQRAADGIQQKALGLVHGFLRELLDSSGRQPSATSWR